jgi:hypothetical protein
LSGAITRGPSPSIIIIIILIIVGIVVTFSNIIAIGIVIIVTYCVGSQSGRTRVSRVLVVWSGFSKLPQFPLIAWTRAFVAEAATQALR